MGMCPPHGRVVPHNVGSADSLNGSGNGLPSPCLRRRTTRGHDNCYERARTLIGVEFLFPGPESIEPWKDEFSPRVLPRSVAPV